MGQLVLAAPLAFLVGFIIGLAMSSRYRIIKVRNSHEKEDQE